MIKILRKIKNPVEVFVTEKEDLVDEIIIIN